jgi:hypothetical protein
VYRGLRVSKLGREFFIPKNAIKVTDKQSDAVAYLSTNSRGMPRAVVFVGKQTKPISDYWFKDEARRAEHVAKVFSNNQRHAARIKERRDARKAFVHNVKVGDLYRTSWGYDQTNVEYFQVVEVKGKYATLREIAQERVNTLRDQGKCVPLKDAFLTPKWEGDERGVPIRRLIQDGHIKICDVRTAWPVVMTEIVPGVKVASAAYWSEGH